MYPSRNSYYSCTRPQPTIVNTPGKLAWSLELLELPVTAAGTWSTWKATCQAAVCCGTGIEVCASSVNIQ
eukprot:3431080-Prymnesium_polylepis.3